MEKPYVQTVKDQEKVLLRCPRCSETIPVKLTGLYRLTPKGVFELAKEVGFRWMGGYFAPQPYKDRHGRS